MSRLQLCSGENKKIKINKNDKHSTHAVTTPGCTQHALLLLWFMFIYGGRWGEAGPAWHVYCGPRIRSRRGATGAEFYMSGDLQYGQHGEGGEAESRFQGQTGGSEFKAAGGLFFNLIFWLLTESHVQLLSILHQLRFCFSSCESLPAFTITCSQPHPPNAMVVLRDQMHWNWKKKSCKSKQKTTE